MKILYGVQGTGNGHIARARALNRELNRLGADIDFIFSGRNPADYFALDDFPKHALYQGLRLAYTAGKVDIVKPGNKINYPWYAVRLIHWILADTTWSFRILSL